MISHDAKHGLHIGSYIIKVGLYLPFPIEIPGNKHCDHNSPFQHRGSLIDNIIYGTEIEIYYIQYNDNILILQVVY